VASLRHIPVLVVEPPAQHDQTGGVPAN